MGVAGHCWDVVTVVRQRGERQAAWQSGAAREEHGVPLENIRGANHVEGGGVRPAKRDRLDLVAPRRARLPRLAAEG